MTEPVGRLSSVVVDTTDPDATARFSEAALGARRFTADAVVHNGESFRVYAGPAGHPFCLIQQVAPDL